MADVARTDDRGQLVLVAAITLAVLFVAFASVLNAAMFAETTATDSADASFASAAVSFQHATVDGVDDAIETANEYNNTSRSDLDTALSTAIGDWDSMAGTHGAVDARAAAVSLASTEDGRLLAQDVTRNFTNASGTADWTLATDVTASRGFTVTVSDASVLALNGSLGMFTITVEDGATTWEATVARAVTGDVVVTVNDGASIETCSTSDGTPVTLDLSAGTLAGDDCDALRFDDDVTGSYNISVANGDNVEGTFAVIVDKPTLSSATLANYGPVGAGPYQTPAVYAATVDVVYEGPNGRYEGTVRVEPDGGAQ